jgi:hypothetical protein
MRVVESLSAWPHTNRNQDFLGRFRGKAREILELLVDKYRFWGARRTKPEICRVRPLSEHGTFTPIAELFQGARNLRKAEWTSYR